MQLWANWVRYLTQNGFEEFITSELRFKMFWAGGQKKKRALPSRARRQVVGPEGEEPVDVEAPYNPENPYHVSSTAPFGKYKEFSASS